MRLDPVEEAGVDRAQGGIGVTVEQLTDVRTRHEHAWYERVQHEHTVISRLVEGRVERVDHRLVKGVASLGPVEADEEHGAALFGHDHS